MPFLRLCSEEGLFYLRSDRKIIRFGYIAGGGAKHPLLTHERSLRYILKAFNLYRARCIGDGQNVMYPDKVTVGDGESLRQAVCRDYVAVEYKGSYRSGSNFIRSDCLALDCDNDDSENPDSWVTPEDVMSVLPGATVGFHYSRHNGLPKEGKSARPRFHCFFLIDEMRDATAYRDLKKRLNALFPVFDTKALDSARFFFGTEDPQVMFIPGTLTLNECLDRYYSEDPFTDMPDASETIPEGSRNSTMHRFAVKVLKRFGLSDEAKQLFRERSEKCVPPLDDQELRSIWRSALKFYNRTIAVQPDYVKPGDYTATPLPQSVEPIPFGRYELDPFPVDALPKDIGDYVKAVAESTQTPVDMAGTAVLALLAVCLQGKYAVQGKDDWTEPLNLFANIIAEPSERKSAVLHATASPLDNYEVQYNAQNAARVESCKMRRRILERRQRAIEDKVAKGSADASEIDRIAQELAEFVEEKPLRLYVDDITTEKLVSVMSENNGRAALVSSEGGIFDTLAGIYTRNVNIDVMLKGYSGDTIRVDRIGRESESVMNPTLSVLLMTQPKVVSDVLSNATFRGRGLTARFLYCLPTSSVGSRRFQSAAVTPELYSRYERKMVDMLEDEYPKKPECITLSPEAARLLTDFAEEIEPKIKTDYVEIADWVGKLVGNTLRISGLLCRAGVYRAQEFLTVNEPLVVSGKTMADAILLGRYFLNHVLAVYDVIPEATMYRQARRILQMIDEKHLTEFDRRLAMRNCRTFKTVTDIQPVLDFLDDYGYIIRLPDKTSAAGRPPLPKYVVNPSYLSQLSDGRDKNG